MLELVAREVPDHKQLSLVVLPLIMVAVVVVEVVGTQIVKQLLEQVAVPAAAVAALVLREIHLCRWDHPQVQQEQQTLVVAVEAVQHATVEYLHKIR
jgi:hypothetical protein